jgi:oxygen-independent coproporphyrinogen-3 oxidase
LEQKKFVRYEVSNWGKTNKNQSHHNVLIWKTNEWAAIGWGAYGFENNIYYRYGGDILKWKLIKKTLTKKELYQQVLIMGLRLSKGLNLQNKLVNESYSFFKKELDSSPLFIKNKNTIKCRNINLLNCLLEKII